MSTRLSDLGLKRSTYLISCSLPNGDIRLMSTLWKSVVDLDSRHYSMLLNQPFEPTDEDMHDLAELERIRILVRKDIDEFSLARTTIESWKRPPILSVTYCLT